MAIYLHPARRERYNLRPVGVADDWILKQIFGIALNVPDVMSIVTVAAPTTGYIEEAPVSRTPDTLTVPAVPTVSAIARNYSKKASAVTMSIGNPCVVTYAGHGFANDQVVLFTTTGLLPTGVAIQTEYYVANKATDTFNISPYVGGSPLIASTGSQSGVHSLLYLV